MEKKREQGYRIKLFILFGLLGINLLIPASYMLERIHYTRWDEDLALESLERDIVASYKLGLEETKKAQAIPVKERNVEEPPVPGPEKAEIDPALQRKMDEWREKLLGTSKLASEFRNVEAQDSDFRIYAVRREFSVMKAVIRHLLIRKDDRDILLYNVKAARKDWVITPREAEHIMNSIRELNKNAKDKWDFLPI